MKFYDLRLQIRDRCKKMGCSYRDPAPSSGLGEEPRPVVKPMTQEAKEPEKKEVPKEFAPPPEGKPKAPSAKWPVVISTAAVGAVGVGLGVGFFVASEGKKDEAVGLKDDLKAEGLTCGGSGEELCDEYRNAKQSFYDLQTASTVGFIAGGALVGGAVVMAIVWPEATRPSALRELRPVVATSPQGTYFGISGSF